MTQTPQIKKNPAKKNPDTDTKGITRNTDTNGITKLELQSPFLSLLAQRGYIHQCTNYADLDQKLKTESVIAYCGYDCTADSLHAGSLLSIMLLRHLQKCGHKPVILLGGGTTKIGDPSGKDEARRLIDDQAIENNMAGIKKIFARFLEFGDGPQDALVVNNADWLDQLKYINFLRHYGRHFSVNRMLGFDSVKLRLERQQPLSFLEFNYMILQAFDFLELSRRHGCCLQFGGSDQWGNIVNGIDLKRRIDGTEIYGLTTPLLTTASGAKMGKTAEGAIWLNEERLSHFDYYQFWRNTDDADVIRFMRLFTELTESEIAAFESMEGAEINEAKKILAFEATTLCRGSKAAQKARQIAQETFEKGILSQDLPTIQVSRDEVKSDKLSLFTLLVRAGLVATNSEGRRMMRGGGTRLNGLPVTDESRTLKLDDFGVDEQKPDQAKLSAGKKKHAIIQLI